MVNQAFLLGEHFYNVIPYTLGFQFSINNLKPVGEPNTLKQLAIVPLP